MEKIFVLVPYMGRTSEEIQQVREDALALYIEQRGVEAELSLPHGKRLTGDIEALFASDAAVKVRYSDYDPVCHIVNHVANVYGVPVYMDNHVPNAPVEEPEEGGESE